MYQAIEKKMYEVQTLTQAVMIDCNLFAASNVSTHVVLEPFMHAIRVNIQMKMAGEVVEEHHYPLNWLEAFKERWFPKFLLQRYPVRYCKVKTWQCYPKFPLQEGQRNVIQYIVATPEVV